MNVYGITLGCKVNQYETQAMMARLQEAGFSLSGQEEGSDVILINSCTVTAASDHKVRQALHRARRLSPTAVIVLTGCMPQAFPQLAEQLTDADIVLGNSNRAALLPDIMRFLSSRQRIVDIQPHEKGEGFEAMQVERLQPLLLLLHHPLRQGAGPFQASSRAEGGAGRPGRERLPGGGAHRH